MLTRLVLILTAALGLGAVQAAPHADLSGLWTSTSQTMLERPDVFQTLTVTDSEATAFERRRPGEFANTDIDDIGGRQSEADYWDVGAKLARIDGRARTSWIVEPADGKLPWSAQGLAARAREQAAHTDSANPETRSASERCLLAGWAAAGPPMLNSPYANEYQIVQTRDSVAIALEAIHDVRIIRLVSRPAAGRTTTGHLPSSVFRPWLGDTVGWWEGATLVAETTNFNPGDALKIPLGYYISPQARVTELFTRMGPDAMSYSFTVDDPATFKTPWRAEMVFRTSKGPMLEYACHEGNYSLPGILAGARREEAQARAGK